MPVSAVTHRERKTAVPPAGGLHLLPKLCTRVQVQTVSCNLVLNTVCPVALHVPDLGVTSSFVGTHTRNGDVGACLLVHLQDRYFQRPHMRLCVSLLAKKMSG